MELETLRTYLLEKKGATEERPFGPEALVFKVMVKGLKKAVRQELEAFQ